MKQAARANAGSETRVELRAIFHRGHGRGCCHRAGPVVALLCAWLTCVTVAQQTIIRIEAGQPGKSISPYLIGVFFEDLNYAADGGLYAELIQNRSFEYSPTEQPDWHPLKFWDVVSRGGADGYVRVEDSRPIHENNPNYALIVVRHPGDGFGLANSGFDCIPLNGGERYNFSFWAYQAFMGEMWGRGDHTRPMPVTVRLEDQLGNVLAQASFEVRGRQWHKYAAALTPTRSEPRARMVLLAHAQGGICVDMISLFPEKTFRGRPNGLRADLAQAIADLKPKFIRFPGGCLVHGLGLRHLYNWKETVGPVEQRRARRNVWGYHQTRGLGYFELFQFCEDIGAIPIPVVPAGVTCQHAGSSPNRGQEALPLDQMPALVQDILDLIEWANGPTNSRWGAVRAAAGRPEPFGLKYLAVGNEEEITPAFKERFKMIYDAVKAKHPEIVVIGTVGPFASGRDYDEGWKFARELRLEMVDEHYYVPPQWFWQNLQRYDKYDRAGPKVYVGEYAAHDRDRRRNTLRSAIAEAAGLTALERNGDIVWFASYAPLLARRGHTQWHPDLIYFDATNVYLTANYYVQMLFGQNSGDRYLATAIEPSPNPPTLAASAVRDSKSGRLIIKIVNGADTPARLSIKLIGLSTAELKGVKTVLTGPSPDAFNEDGKEPVVKPVTADVTVKPEFDYDAPAWSLTVFSVRD
ncbi:MAG: alpha-L-arabinofuranosidase C-terminal domain-containing protein [Verrucomicrobiales bacterium]|nr:alpha-L-arabinofuranosidase C-terminal domain-containing protein [Verrucomicrobiales bacterium]